jgi:hypothetical protein
MSESEERRVDGLGLMEKGFGKEFAGAGFDGEKKGFCI